MALNYWNLIVREDTKQIIVFQQRNEFDYKTSWGLLSGKLNNRDYSKNVALLGQEVLEKSSEDIRFQAMFLRVVDILPENNCYLISTVITGPHLLPSSSRYLDTKSIELDNIKVNNPRPELLTVAQNYSNIDYFLNCSLKHH